MLLLRTATATPFAYAKVDKADADEARRLKARYLIHKVLEESVPTAAPPAKRSSPALLARVRARMGVRLKRLRLAVRGVRARASRTVRRHLRSLTRLLVQRSPAASASPS